VAPLFRSRPRTAGDPPSGNGASSFHLTWMLPPTEPLVEVAVQLEVVVPPEVDRLYFWALQVSFLDGVVDRGGAHVGLQWNRRHPDHGAVNWGGYRPGGGLLDGTDSALPSTPRDPNTRDYPWQPERPYRLRVSAAPGSTGAWQGEVTDLTTGEATVVRHLLAGGDRLVRPMVWSEVFARCDHPSVTARWSSFEVVTAAGERLAPRAVQVNYQARAAGGCDNTTVAVEPDGAGILQVTAAERVVAQGAVLPLA
jgi:hypothetical protein